MSISRIDRDTIDRQFTATDLIGKEVYDSADKKIGEVKDVVLGSAAGSHLAMAFAGSSQGAAGSNGYSSTTGSTDASRDTSTTAGSARSSSTATSTGSTSGSGMAGTEGTRSTAGSSIPSGMSGSMGAQAHSALSELAAEPAAIVSVGGFMGVGDNLVRVPLSQLNYDATTQRLTVAMSQSEISSLTDTGSTAE